MALRTVTYNDTEWTLVPREPTLGMGRALTPWMKADVETGTYGPVALAIAQWMLGSFREDYQAMLDAAPQPDDPPSSS